MSPRRAAAESLSRDALVERALAVADAEGLEAVTIRRLGQELGVTPMALYWHVRNKEELLDAMGDALFAGLTVESLRELDWDQQLAGVVRALASALRRHPTCLPLAYRRILSCREGQEVTEFTLALLREAGFDRRQSADIGTYALQTAVLLVSGEPGAEPGRTAEEQSEILAAKRAGLMNLPAERYPRIREMAADLLHCDDMDSYYEFGIRMFVAGAREARAREVATISA